MVLKTVAEYFAVRTAPERVARAASAIVFKPLPSHDVILRSEGFRINFWTDPPNGNKPEMFESLASCFAFHCSVLLNMTALCKGGVFSD
jgi:hypothetical protein